FIRRFRRFHRTGESVEVEGDIDVIALRISFDLAAGLLLAAGGFAGGKQFIAHGLLINLAGVELIAYQLDQLEWSAQEPFINGFGANDIIEQRLQFISINAVRKQWVDALFA